MPINKSLTDTITILRANAEEARAQDKVRSVKVGIHRASRPLRCWEGKQEIQCRLLCGGDAGSLHLKIRPAYDIRTKKKDLGYRLIVVSGDIPYGMNWPRFDHAAPIGEFSISWSDGYSHEQDAFDFMLSVQAIDKAGNVGPARFVRVSHPGRPAKRR